MITIKNEEDIKHLREGGKRLCEILNKVEQRIQPGVSTKELDEYAERLTHEGGDIPILKGYHPSFADRPYPASICVSINDEIVHGIPRKNRVIQEGDIVGIDMSISHNERIVDSARTVPVGDISAEAMKLLSVTRNARTAGIQAARAGNHVGDIGYAIETFVQQFGYGVVRELCGHGVGYAVHEEPNVPNFGEPGEGPKLQAGMVLAIEPMINLGSEEVVYDPDGYTVRTKDGKRSAHFEHSVLLTEGAPEVLTEC